MGGQSHRATRPRPDGPLLASPPPRPTPAGGGIAAMSATLSCRVTRLFIVVTHHDADPRVGSAAATGRIHRSLILRVIVEIAACLVGPQPAGRKALRGREACSA